MLRNDKKERIGWYFYDWANSAFATTVIAVFLNPYLTAIAEKGASADGFLRIIGIEIFVGSYYEYVIAVSVFLQLLVLPVIGVFVDYSQRKKLLLGVFAYLGAIATMGMFFISGTAYLLGGVLLILANLSFGASMVIYNSILNDIAAPDRRDAVSSIGWAFGYLGGGLLLALNLIFYSMSDKLLLGFENHAELAIRICLCSAGLWWGVFSIMPMVYIRTRKETKPIPSGRHYLTFGFKQFNKTLKDARNYPGALLFLAAFFLYNDGVQAVIISAGKFGKKELGLSIMTLTQVILMVQFVAFFGALFFNWVAKLINTKNAIITSLIIWIAIVIYAFAFLQDELGFYFLGAAIAIVMGGTQALSRSLYSRVIPIGKEAEYFSLYEISEKGTSMLGPLLFGITLQISGSYRLAIFSLIIFFIIGLILLAILNINKAERSAQELI